MGAWGAGLTQSDEYCEVYEFFMEKYDTGESVEAITDEILNKYLSQFDLKDGIVHDVYFALAKCQWMCGSPSRQHSRRIAENTRTNGCKTSHTFLFGSSPL